MSGILQDIQQGPVGVAGVPGRSGIIIPGSPEWSDDIVEPISPLGILGRKSYAWESRTFDAANYLADGVMTWTVAAGNVQMERFIIDNENKIMLMALFIFGSNTSIVAGAVGYVKIKIPGGRTARFPNANGCNVTDNAVSKVAQVTTSTADPTYLYVLKIPYANFVTNVNNFDVNFIHLFEIL